MRKAMGPVLTTGVALVAAAVVVANPIAPPVRDLQISTTELSTSPGSLIPFDKNLLKSITQPSPSATFAAALAQILGALAAESDRIGTEVNSGVSTLPDPASAAASRTPSAFVPVPAAPSDATPSGAPSTATTLLPAAAAASAPVFQQVASVVSAETTYLGNQVVEAAYATVDALVNTPYLIIQAVKAVLVGDLSTAVATIVQAIKAFIHPGLVLVGDFGNVFDQYVLPSTNSTPSAGAAALTTPVSPRRPRPPRWNPPRTRRLPPPTRAAPIPRRPSARAARSTPPRRVANPARWPVRGAPVTRRTRPPATALSSPSRRAPGPTSPDRRRHVGLIDAGVHCLEWLPLSSAARRARPLASARVQFCGPVRSPPICSAIPGYLRTKLPM